MVYEIIMHILEDFVTGVVQMVVSNHRIIGRTLQASDIPSLGVSLIVRSIRIWNGDMASIVMNIVSNIVFPFVVVVQALHM